MHKRLSIALFVLTSACSTHAPDADPARTPAGVTTVEGSLDAPSAVAAREGRDVALVVHAAKRSWVVLDASPDLSWAVGEPSLLDATLDGDFAVRRSVDGSKIPGSARQALHQRLRLRGQSGAVCEAFVDDLAIFGRFSPDGESYSRWRGEARDEDDRPLPAPTRAEIAIEAWTLADGSHALVGELRAVAGQCADATFAVMRGEPLIEHPRQADDATSRAALAAFRALPDHESHAAEYRDQVGSAEARTVPWDSRDESSPTVKTVTFGGERLVWVSAGSRGGCGDFNAQLSALFRQTSRGLETVRVLDGWSSDLQGVVRHGEALELLFLEARVRLEEDGIEKLEIPSFGCDC